MGAFALRRARRPSSPVALVAPPTPSPLGLLRDRQVWMVWALGAIVAVLQWRSLLPLDADEASNSLAPLQVLHGQWPVWLGGQSHLGALRSYFDAPLVALLGPVDVATRIWSLALRLLDPLIVMAAVDTLLGRRAARVAGLLAAFWPLQLCHWLLGAFNMGLSVVLWHLAILMVARTVVAERTTTLGAALLGLVGGLAVWNSLQSLIVIGPFTVAFLLADLRRPGWLRRTLILAAAFALASSPWWIYSLSHGFRGDYIERVGRLPIGLGLGGRLYIAAGNYAYYAVEIARRAISIEPYADGGPSIIMSAVSTILQIALISVFVVFELLVFIRRMPRERRALFWRLAVPGALAMFVVGVGFTGPGTSRGPLERYLIPIYALLPFIIPWLMTQLPRRLAPALPALFCLPTLVALAHLGHAHAAGRTSPLSFADFQAERTRGEVEAQIDAVHATYVMGNFWDVAPYTYWSAERVESIHLNARWHWWLNPSTPASRPGNGVLLLRDGSPLSDFVLTFRLLDGLTRLPASPPWQMYLLPEHPAHADDTSVLYTSIASYSRELRRFEAGELDDMVVTPGMFPIHATRIIDHEGRVGFAGSTIGQSMVWGPYLQLEAGTYDIELDFAPPVDGPFQVTATITNERRQDVLWRQTGSFTAAGGTLHGTFTTPGGPDHEAAITVDASGGPVVLIMARLHRQR